MKPQSRTLLIIGIALLLLPAGHFALATPPIAQHIEQVQDVQPRIERPFASLTASLAIGAGLAAFCILLIVLVWRGYIHPSILDEHRRL